MNDIKTHIDSAAKKIKTAQILRVLTLFVLAALFASATFAQTAGGTQILNQASATYGDGGGGTYSTVSNTVTVTVANVSGLAITPDAGSHAAVVAGQTGVVYSFRVTNTGNFADQVRFLASGASVQASSGGTITAAVIDNGNGVIGAGDTDILGNGADVLSSSILQNGFIDVLVSVNISSTASGSVSVTLGDAATGAPTYDNQAANSSPNEVRTVSASSVNGLREARGSVSAAVEVDAQLVLSLTAPAGPLNAATASPAADGSVVNYSWQLCNTGLRAASSITLSGAPAGSNTGVFIIAPVPTGTKLTSGQTFPAGTLYSTTALTTSPLTATYTTVAPADLTTVRRMAFRAGSSLAASGSAGACSAAFPMQVTVTTTDATNDIYEIGDAFGSNSIGTSLTDQSGDSLYNKGDGNANFDEPVQGGAVSSTQGFQQKTLLTRTGATLIGPLANPAAVGPTNNNDDYTNRSVSTGIAGVAFGGNTTATGQFVFDNTIKNNGNANDTFAISVPTIPAGFTVEISTDGGATYTTMMTNSVSVAINFGATKDIKVRVSAPSGIAVLNGFAVVIRATSVLTSSAVNDTIDRLYTGFVRMDKSFALFKADGTTSTTDAVPGAIIEYTIAYQNIASTGGTGNSTLLVSNLVITENGSTAPNNWASYTDQVVGSAADVRGGVSTTSGITGDAAGSNVLTDTVASLAAQSSGTFKFRRTIR